MNPQLDNVISEVGDAYPQVYRSDTKFNIGRRI